MIESNFSQLRKKVFVKEKIVQTKTIVKLPISATNPKKVATTSKKSAAASFKSGPSKGASSFKSASTVSTASNFLPFSNPVEETPSALTSFLDDSSKANSEGDFLLPIPSEGDPTAVKIKIYLFSTPKFINVTINKASKIGDLIKHLITIYKKDPLLSNEKPLLYPTVPDAYELRLIDDEDGEASYKPFYEVGALDRREKVGDQ
jgi:hypothetical protein